jgi:hypothetical protein
MLSVWPTRARTLSDRTYPARLKLSHTLRLAVRISAETVKVVETGGTPRIDPLDLYPCCRSTVVRVEGRVIIRRSHAPYVPGVGPSANRCPAAIR